MGRFSEPFHDPQEGRQLVVELDGEVQWILVAPVLHLVDLPLHRTDGHL